MSGTGSMPRRAGQLGPTVAVFGQFEALRSEVHGPGGDMWVNQLQDQRVVFKQGPTGSVWALERSVKDRLNKGHRPAKRAGTDPTTGFQVSPTQWHAWSSTSTVTWPTLVCPLALQPGRGQLANLLFGKSMVVTCSSTWLGDPPFIFACRLGGVDKFLRYSGTSWMIVYRPIVKVQYSAA